MKKSKFLKIMGVFSPFIFLGNGCFWGDNLILSAAFGLVVGFALFAAGKYIAKKGY